MSSTNQDGDTSNHDQIFVNEEQVRQSSNSGNDKCGPGEDKEKKKNVNAMEWDGPDDSRNPRKFSTTRKVYITGNLAMLTFLATFASSILSPANQVLSTEFGISSEVSILATALYVLGFAFGPTVFGPASEVLGRRNPLSVGMFMFAIFTIPVARAQNPATIFTCRFISGVFASAPLAIKSKAGGGLADLYDTLPRGIAVAGFASATFLGPVLGPIADCDAVGGFVTMSHLGWRWTQWLLLILGISSVLLYFFTVPETYSPVLLSRRTKQTLLENRNVAIQAEANRKPINLRDLSRKYILKPWIMIAQEPILALITLHMGFVFAFLYLCFEAYPIAFEQHRGWNIGVGALPFLAVTAGVLVGVAIIIFHTKTRMQRRLQIHGEVPEERLIPMMLGSLFLAIGMFWFGWTSDPDITWGLNYLIDVYKMNANSAISINAMFRGVLAAGFPMFAPYMVSNPRYRSMDY
ncbi:hypothetical protein HO133_002602 [Letharia lupina]|uniref:Major facilitator superfamily (MFS) profile domain-containing protein n=1 Tax=Letharia lupina TaxID=560253 RepID=A0A8H6CCE2_9LECA|nr:uncharacterized protein HO133_002602 [Letharia lupina]KAF6220922.1 hypothetical protein HO133_002602 [Letharia lupina]